jgi:hypothetical protein
MLWLKVRGVVGPDLGLPRKLIQERRTEAMDLERKERKFWLLERTWSRY